MAQLDQQQVLEGHTDRVWNVAWSPTGSHLLYTLGRVRDNTAIQQARTPSAGDSIASCSGDKTVRIWRQHGSTDTWICAAILEETHHRSIRCSSWSPDGRHLATASFDATTAIWEVQVLKPCQGHCRACVSHAPVERRTKQQILLQGNTWDQVALLEGHESEVKGVAWSSSGLLHLQAAHYPAVILIVWHVLHQPSPW